MRHQHYVVFNTEGPLRATRGRWKIEGPGLKPALYFSDHTTAITTRRALEQAFETGRGRTRETLEPIGQRVEDEKTDAGIGTMKTITDVRR